MKICDEQKCTGCFACMNICPRSAITVGNDYLDKTIPVIDPDKCVGCGLCQSVCPVNHPVAKQKAEYSIAAWSKNAEDIAFSSSGGMAAVFSRAVIRQGGIVFGTANEDNHIHIIAIHDETEISKLRGSNYVQNEVWFAYRDIQHCLKKGIKVLFISTPCQIAGLKNYLKKDYNDLITVDLICHGVPPQKYLFDYLKSILPRQNSSKVEFRGKYDYKFTVLDDSNRILYQKSSQEDHYLKAFLDSVILRDNCYACPYSCPDRCADITIGDFWGLDRSTLQNSYSGKISVVLPNTEKGARFFDQCRDEMIWEKRSIDDACNDKQGNLLHPSIPSEDRAAFIKYYPKCGFEKALVKHTQLGKELMQKNKRMKLHRSILYRAYVKIRSVGKRIAKWFIK